MKNIAAALCLLTLTAHARAASSVRSDETELTSENGDSVDLQADLSDGVRARAQVELDDAGLCTTSLTFNVGTLRASLADDRGQEREASTRPLRLMLSEQHRGPDCAAYDFPGTVRRSPQLTMLAIFEFDGGRTIAVRGDVWNRTAARLSRSADGLYTLRGFDLSSVGLILDDSKDGDDRFVQMTTAEQFQRLHPTLVSPF